VPTATNTGVDSGASFFIAYGSHEPFDPAKVASLYPTHESYVHAVRQVAHRNVRKGFELEEDAKAIVGMRGTPASAPRIRCRFPEQYRASSAWQTARPHKVIGVLAAQCA